MHSQTIAHDFDQFCLARIQAIFEADTNHEDFQKRSNHFYQVRDQLELLRQPEINTYLDALEKYQVEAFLYIYRVAFEEGLQFIKTK
ncbi:hypothetical protein HCJ66_04220 [Listeria sp. FSL L7-1582]|uniref:hypothetical protein n=1 Tax=Listeria portnoyi TaxID=2713504 RepID=UPI00164D4A4F|nr:hypothetical protein [Listeria portnoyi]MBC6308757.1 hypothetical protein [Listeria portnoyi]